MPRKSSSGVPSLGGQPFVKGFRGVDPSPSTRGDLSGPLDVFGCVEVKERDPIGVESRQLWSVYPADGEIVEEVGSLQLAALQSGLEWSETAPRIKCANGNGDASGSRNDRIVPRKQIGESVEELPSEKR